MPMRSGMPATPIMAQSVERGLLTLPARKKTRWQPTVKQSDVGCHSYPMMPANKCGVWRHVLPY
nr:hypothetical protein [Pectobacterium versatile]